MYFEAALAGIRLPQINEHPVIVKIPVSKSKDPLTLLIQSRSLTSPRRRDLFFFLHMLASEGIFREDEGAVPFMVSKRRPQKVTPLAVPGPGSLPSKWESMLLGETSQKRHRGRGNGATLRKEKKHSLESAGRPPHLGHP